MNINAISAYVPKSQPVKTVSNVSFTGLEKAAWNVGTATGEAAANAAGKLGIAGKIAKIISFSAKSLKKLGQGILHSLNKLFNKGAAHVNMCMGKNITMDTVNGTQVANVCMGKNNVTQVTAEFGNAFKGVSEKLGNMTKGSDILQKNGETYIFGKLYKPGYKLPSGVVIKKNGLSINTTKSMSELMDELKKLSEEWK